MSAHILLKHNRSNIVRMTLTTIHARDKPSPIKHVMAIKFKLWDEPHQPVVYQYKRFQTAQDMYSAYKRQLWYLNEKCATS
jgi:hypothetical protein